MFILGITDQSEQKKRQSTLLFFSTLILLPFFIDACFSTLAMWGPGAEEERGIEKNSTSNPVTTTAAIR